MRLRTLRRDAGFTLVELLVAIAILGIVATALVGVVFEYFRVGNETSTRLNESTDQQFVSTYWQQDVSSLGLHGFAAGATTALPTMQSVWQGAVPSGLPASCTSMVSGSPVVTLAWNDYPSGGTDPDATWTNAVANYAIYFTSGTAMYRVRCGGTTTRLIVARHLDPAAAAPSITCTDATGATAVCAASSPPAAVTMTINVRDASQSVHNSTGYTVTLAAERRQG